MLACAAATWAEIGAFDSYCMKVLSYQYYSADVHAPSLH
jgi:hypothetical protein